MFFYCLYKGLFCLLAFCFTLFGRSWHDFCSVKSLDLILTASLLFFYYIKIHTCRSFLWKTGHFLENVTSCHFAISGGTTQLIYLRYSAIRHLERPMLGLKSVRGIRKQRLAAGIPLVNVSIGPSQKSIPRTVETRERAQRDSVINHKAHTNINRDGHPETGTNR